MSSKDKAQGVSTVSLMAGLQEKIKTWEYNEAEYRRVSDLLEEKRHKHYLAPLIATASFYLKAAQYVLGGALGSPNEVTFSLPPAGEINAPPNRSVTVRWSEGEGLWRVFLSVLIGPRFAASLAFIPEGNRLTTTKGTWTSDDYYKLLRDVRESWERVSFPESSETV